jgi:hypothetical protein
MRTLITILTFTLILGAASMATAQPANTLVAEGLSLPKDHQYERYNASSGSYGKVDVSQVPALVKQKQPIYDRTAKAWVYQSGPGLNAKYAAPAAAAAPSTPAPAPSTPAPAPSTPAPSAPAASAPAPSTSATAATAPAVSTPAPVAPLVAEGLSLPRDHQYERYNASSSSYGKVDVSQVPALVKQKQPIYDRTAKAWVYQSAQGLNAQYAAPGSTAVASTAPASTTPASTTPATTAVVAGGLNLPRDHQYERYNGGTNSYGKVDVSQVPTLIGQNVPIYDRTAKVWVYNTERKLDPRYVVAPTGPSSAAAPNLVLPPDHQYERYHVAESVYTRVDASQVPTLVQQKVPIYDRTAKAWVFSTEQQLDPRYVSGAASGSGNLAATSGQTTTSGQASTSGQAAPPAKAGEWQRIHGKIESIQGSSLSFRADDGRVLSVDTSRVAANVRSALTQGEGVTIIGHEWTGANALRAQYVQQDSSDPSRGGKQTPSASPRQ